ncbi:MAG: cytochrome c biogenesis protein CcsA [Saprospiraceae bacterium]|nr:cytochrome c biogenesis protein CcsA [Saprospiraceae bacterium]
MEPIQYVNEHLWVHYCGHAFLILAFFSGIYTLVSGIVSVNKNEAENSEWLKAVKIGFLFHVVFIFLSIVLIFFMMDRHYYEYNYVWSHVSDELARKYILSAFWEGQEGSFLLWMFWNSVLGLFFWKSLSKVNVAIITIIIGVEIILCSMILGVHINGVKIGSSPFVLLRQVMDIPLFKNAEYTSLIKGNGLNPLLQNYWMIIHPPTLFLGFASTIIPFAYAVSALWIKEFKLWLVPSLKWSLFSASILGLGILMGAAWAYEALSFGGYWAWDPVENMSLVPWIILIAGIHSHLVAKSTEYGVRATILFYIFSFVLVVYSSFLTRSGILGESSAHAFTQMGLEWQLLFFGVVSFFVPLFLYIKSSKFILTPKQEEKIESREFWMFMGCLVLLFSAGLITFTTSLPVYNKILDFIGGLMNVDLKEYHRSAPVNVIDHHNRFQIWIGVFVSLLSGIALFLRYCGYSLSGVNKNFWRNIIITLLSALVVAIFVFQFLNKNHWSLFLLLFSGIWAFISSLVIAISILRKNPKIIASVMAHAGFGLLILGIIFSGINKRNFQPELFFQDVETDNIEGPKKNFLLIKGEPAKLEGYELLYTLDSMDNKVRRYHIQFSKGDSTDNAEKFVLNPEIQYDNKLTKVAASNPATKHYLSKDIFTIISQIPKTQMDATASAAAEDSIDFEQYNVSIGDTFYTRKSFGILKNIRNRIDKHEFETLNTDEQLELDFEFYNLDVKKSFLASPAIIFRENLVYRFPDNIDKLSMRIQIPDTIYSVLNFVPNKIEKKSIELKLNDSIQIGDLKFTLLNLNKNPKAKTGLLVDKDIAVAADLLVTKGGVQKTLSPIYVIRDNQSFSIPDISLLPGLSIYFDKIDPNSAVMTFSFFENYTDISKLKIPIEIAENAPRTDYIVMEVIEFPGINLVWLGSLFMVFGLMIGSYQRRMTNG